MVSSVHSIPAGIYKSKNNAGLQPGYRMGKSFQTDSCHCGDSLSRFLNLMDDRIHYHPNQRVKGSTITKHSRTTILTKIIPGKPGCTIIQLVYLCMLAYTFNCLRIMIFLYHSFSSLPSLFPPLFLPPFSLSIYLFLNS